MLIFALFLLLSGVVHGKHVPKKHESNDADFQDAVENIARASIEKIFKDKSLSDQESGFFADAGNAEQRTDEKHKKHHGKSFNRHIRKEASHKSYSNEDQSLYEGNLYQDLYRHLPILPMVPVPLFYEGEDYSGDEPEVASGDELTSDVKLESNINGDDDNKDSSPPSIANQVPQQPFDYPEVKSFSKHGKQRSKKYKKHHKKQHVSETLNGIRLNKEFQQSLSANPAKLPKTGKLHHGKNVNSFTSPKVGHGSHGIKTGTSNTLKGYTQGGSVGAQSGIFSTAGKGYPSSYSTLNGQASNQALGQGGRNLGSYSNSLGSFGASSMSNQNPNIQGLSNTNQLGLPFQGNQLQSNQLQNTQLPGNQFGSNYLGSSTQNTYGNLFPQLGGTQQDTTPSTGLIQPQSNNLLATQSLSSLTGKEGDGTTCPPPCPAACAPKCSATCCNADYVNLNSLLQASCSPSCAPLYSPSCCSSFQGLGQPVASQAQLPCSATCAPQYLPSCCGSAPAPSFQMPIAMPQAYCPSSCAPDYAASCCGSQPAPPMAAPLPQSICSQACAPQYSQSCCNGAIPPSIPTSCPSSCGPSYLPSCCAAASPQYVAAPPSCSPSCAPQYTPACCSSNIGYGLPSQATAPNPPPLQLRVGFKATYLQPKPQPVCSPACSSQCASTCPSQCCGIAKKSFVAAVPLAMPKPSRPLAIPVYRPAIVKQVVLKQPLMKQPIVKQPAPRQIPKKVPVVKPNPMKMSIHAPPNPLNWDKK